jgi:hypothetical protein
MRGDTVRVRDSCGEGKKKRVNEVLTASTPAKTNKDEYLRSGANRGKLGRQKPGEGSNVASSQQLVRNQIG